MPNNGIDLTTYAAGVQPPADLLHSIYKHPTSADFPKLDLSREEICMELHKLRKELEEWKEKQLVKPLRMLMMQRLRQLLRL